MRGLAAILVMLYHYYLESPAPPLWAGAYLSGTFVAVDFFFILSGFVICHAYGERLLGGISPAEYLARRIARLFPMMAFGLFLGLTALYCLSVCGHANYMSRDIVIATIGNVVFIPFLSSKGAGPVFPSDGPLWSIFFELLASVAFIGLIRTKRRTLVKMWAASLGWLVVMAFIVGSVKGDYCFHVNLGWTAKTFVGGFPRVFYGFTCGMLLYQLRSMGSPFPLLKRIQNAPSLHPFILYAVLVGMLLFPYSIKGLYSFIAIMVLAPLLIIQGSTPKCENRAVVRISECCGWLSYPIYCLHIPILYGMRVINEHVSYSTKYGVSCEGMAIVSTIFLGTVSAFLFDWLKVQQKLAGFLKRSCERAWWREPRVEMA
jgi:peptidoglycan/LPS O-acetylase OafA/YrhL